jgi:hypothetical protein
MAYGVPKKKYIGKISSVIKLTIKKYAIKPVGYNKILM